MITWSALVLASEWFLRILMIVVVTRRRRMHAALAWLLIVFFEPLIGWGLYLAIGNYRLPRRRLERHRRLLQKLQAINRRIAQDPHVVHPPVDSRMATSIKLAERLGDMPILSGNDMEIFSDWRKVIDLLIADIDAAQRNINLLMYIFEPDETGRRVVDALMRAAGRGVKCRVLADGVGSARLLRRLGPRMAAAGVEIHPSLPVNPFRRRVARIDLRNHRKIATIDGRIGWTGSQNIINDYYWGGHLAWHDLMARLTGPVVLELQAIFIQDWYFETDEILDHPDILPTPEHTGSLAIQTLPSGPNYAIENYQRMVVDAIHEAQKHVTITTPYFIPDEPFMQALETAVQTDVDVRVIVPRVSDQVLVGAASRGWYDHLLDAGVKVYFYEDHLLHAKSMTIDDEIGFFGTSNFDIRSFTLDFEINLILYGPDAVRPLRLKQQEYLTSSTVLTREEWDRRPFAMKVFQNATKMLSPLL